MSFIRALLWIAVACFALMAVIQVFAVRIPSPIPQNYVEGFEILDARSVAAGAPLYRDPAEPPWNIHVYTPLYTYGLGVLIGQGADGLLAGRLVSYAAVLGTALLIAVSGWRRTGWIAGIVAALYLTQPLIGNWGSIARPDVLAVFFSALGVVTIDRLASSRGVWLGALFFLLALATKQSVGMGLLAAGFFLLLTRPMRAWGLAGLCALGIVLFVALMQWASHGWFLFHTIEANLSPFSWSKVALLERSFWISHWPALIVGCLVLAFCIANRRVSIYAFWFFLAGLSTVAIGRIGSDMNYFLEWITATGFLIAHEWPRDRLGSETTLSRATATLLAGLVIAVAWVHGSNQRTQNAWIEPAETRFEETVSQFDAVPGAIVSDDAGLLLALDRPLLFRPFVMSQLAYANAWNPDPLVAMLNRREIGLVVFESRPGGSPNPSRYTPAMREALARNYVLAGRYKTHRNFEIYAPRN